MLKFFLLTLQTFIAMHLCRLSVKSPPVTMPDSPGWLMSRSNTDYYNYSHDVRLFQDKIAGCSSTSCTLRSVLTNNSQRENDRSSKKHCSSAWQMLQGLHDLLISVNIDHHSRCCCRLRYRCVFFVIWHFCSFSYSLLLLLQSAGLYSFIAIIRKHNEFIWVTE